MKHFGDITKLSGYDLPIVDIVTGGSPCQDLSCAGKRAGLAGERSGLFMEQIRIIKEMRDECVRWLSVQGTDYDWRDIRPRYMVWENVPGAFSSNKGEDFRAVLEETARVADKDAVIPGLTSGKWTPSGCIMGDGWSIAWRVHDAQFWGVPQRRKRISLVADFGGDTAPEILFERKSVSGDFEESGKERERVAGDVGAGIEETGRCLNGWDVQSKHIQPENGRAESLYSGECRYGGGESYVLQSKVFGIGGYNSEGMKSENPHAGIYEAETSRTLDNNGGNPACNQGGMAVVCIEGNGARESHKGNGYVESETMYTLNTVEQHAVAYRKTSHAKTADDGQGWQETNVNDTLNAFDSGESRTPTVVVDKKVYDWHRQDTRMTELGDICVTASASWGAGGNNMPYVLEPKAVESHAQDARYKIGEINQPVSANMEHDPANGGLVMEQEEPIYSIGHDIRSAKFTDDEIVDPLTATDYKDPIKISTYQKVTGWLDCGITKGTGNQLANQDMFVANASIVRRLTPMECERLQGFPDHWTDIGEWIDSKGKKHKDADSPRYKALGNSIALPFWEWMAKRMRKYLSDDPTMASLFDGIGGFPLSYSRAGVRPVWASEIEEFPIAVTKLHFSDDNVNICQ